MCMYMYTVHILQKIFKFCLHIIIYMYIQSVGIIDTCICICGMLFQPFSSFGGSKSTYHWK